MFKKRLYALFTAASFLLSACSLEETYGSERSSHIPSASSSGTPSHISVTDNSESEKVTENIFTIPQITEPSVAEVIPPQFTKEQLESKYLYFSGKDQFVVSKKRNIITIVLDAADTQYTEALLEENPKALAPLKDFTFYTNTCSVFDSTYQSFTQIFTGITELPVYKIAPWNEDAWQSERAGEFYRRFHKAGYKMNFYVDADWELRHLIGKSDNLALSDEPPTERDYYHGNYGFNDMLSNVKAAKDDNNYFIVHHLWGAHTPIAEDTFAQQMEYLFGIVDNYIKRLKKLKVYEDSTIIIMGDHGSHDLYAYPDSTPLFMIKEAGSRNDEIKISSAPISFADLMATYLVNAGLYDSKTDKKLFGCSIYDFNEGDVRERTANYRWYNPNYPPSGVSPLCHSYGYNVIYSYTYKGDRKDLLKAVNDDDAVITWMEEDAA